MLAKDEASLPRLNDVLYNLIECIRVLGILLTPFMPETAAKMLAQINVEGGLAGIDSIQNGFGAADGFHVGTPAPLFARIDAEKLLAEIAAENEAKAAEAQKNDETDEKPENIAFLPEISIDDFAKVDLRVAEITDCEPVKRAKKLLKLTLNDGSGTPRTVCSGIAKWYTPADLKGRRIVLVSNLRPAVLCGVESQGMILAADDGEDVKVLFVDGVAPGSRIR